ncbi:MAG: S24/S26 family peptidase [Lentisphaerae bacterium]|nr:S24/S26 family peptidase [Lentisphaerota bacterium]
MRDLLSATLERNLPCRFRARGFSMAPVIRDGDVIMVCPITSRPPQLGDVIAFRHPATQALRVHRIIASRRDGYLLRGDSAQQADGLIRAEQVLGLVTQVEHNGARKRFGFGRERLLLALLSRLGLLSLARLSVGFLWRSFRRV